MGTFGKASLLIGGTAGVAYYYLKHTNQERKSIDSEKNQKFNDYTYQGSRWGWGWNEKLQHFTNWHHNYYCTPKDFLRPQNEEEIISILQKASQENRKIRVIGAGCSPNDCAKSDDILMNLVNMNEIIIHKESQTVTVKGNVTFKELVKALKEQNLGLSILTSIDNQSVLGGVANGIHGTGIDFGCLSSYVKRIRVILPTGKILDLNKEDPLFSHFGVSLGLLGVVTEVELSVEPYYKLHARQKPTTFDDFIQNWKEKVYSAEHFRAWWFPHTKHVMEWRGDRVPVDTPNECIGDLIANQKKFFNFCLENLLFVSRYFPTISHYINPIASKVLFNSETSLIDTYDNVFTFDCLFRQYVNEYCIPIEHTGEAIQELAKVIEKNEKKWGCHFPIEIRFVKGDNLSLSPSYQRDSCYIGIIMYKPFNNEPPSFWKEYFQEYEKIVSRYGGRPHWAKSHQLQYADFDRLYPSFSPFMNFRQSIDPNNTFLNPYFQNICIKSSN